jgi:phosphate transport system substrate-binding protein
MKSRIFLLFVLLSGASVITTSNAESLSGKIKVDGSSTVYPLSKAMAEAFHVANPDVQVDVKFSGTGGGFRKFCAGETDIEGASRPIKAEENQQCKSRHIDYIEVQIAFDSLAVVVNPNNAFANCMTVQELKTIWEPAAQSKITNWQQVRANFPSQSLTLLGPSKEDGTFDYFTLAIVGAETSSRTDYTASVDYAALVRGVQTAPNALAYFGYAYYHSNKGSLKAIAVDNGHGCVLPSAETVANGSYQPLSRPLFLYINVSAASRPEVKSFARSFLTPGSGQLVTQVGYVPLPLTSLAAQDERLEKKVVGSAFGAHGSVVGVKFGWWNKNIKVDVTPDDEEKMGARLAQ